MKAPSPRAYRTTNAVVVYLIIQVSLQVFLVTVAVDAWVTGDASVAWACAVVSVVLAGGSALFVRYLHA